MNNRKNSIFYCPICKSKFKDSKKDYDKMKDNLFDYRVCGNCETLIWFTKKTSGLEREGHMFYSDKKGSFVKKKISEYQKEKGV